MSAISITAANVVGVSDVVPAKGIAGATITAGQPLYKDTANNSVLKPCDANLSLLAATVAGIALHGAASGQPIEYATGGTINMGATLVAGTIYVAGASSAGDVNPSADLTTGWYTSILGVAVSSANLKLSINNSGVQN